ncbi:hypothetical protein OG871_03995 [Kitasatospora sp. NBC_00374]|uniref:hypothetical protein n=1 Tax=Kitasatospora sp. NBC_00374 TaxID=2975964 RepID=UPI0030E3E702
MTCGGWWELRRDALLHSVARELLLWGEDVLDDPGAGEIAELLAAVAAQTAADTRHPDFPDAADLLARAATEVARADRFRGTLLPQVARHLRTALALLREARLLLACHRSVPLADAGTG